MWLRNLLTSTSVKVTRSQFGQVFRCIMGDGKTKTAVVLLAEGAEEMEAVISIDVLRRAGINVTVAGVSGPGAVKCSRNTVVVPDVALSDVAGKEFDVVVLPGGKDGADNLAKSEAVKDVLTTQESSGRLVAAICAAPAVSLLGHSIGVGKRVTSYPALKSNLTDSGKYNYVDERVVTDGSLITSQGPGTAFEFALAIVEKLMGSEAAAATAKPMLLK